MGNCLMGGPDRPPCIRVATTNGGIMEFSEPITVDSITDQFPAHGIFRTHDLFWKPLPHTEVLMLGESYHLLPLLESAGKGKVGHLRSNSAPPLQLGAAPYRMSFDSRKRSVVAEEEEKMEGFWKVRLAISPEQLVEILAEEGKTEELIESVRTVAKCGSGVGMGLAGGFSDQWSLASSRNAASSKSSRDNNNSSSSNN